MSLRSPLKPAVSRVLPQGCAPLQQWSRSQRAGWPSRRFPTRWRASRSTVSSPGIPRAGLRLTSCIPTFFPRPERPGVLIRLFQPSRPPHTSRQYESADQRLLSGWSISGARLEMSCCGIKRRSIFDPFKHKIRGEPWPAIGMVPVDRTVIIGQGPIIGFVEIIFVDPKVRFLPHHPFQINAADAISSDFGDRFNERPRHRPSITTRGTDDASAIWTAACNAVRSIASR
jgi:hypothetical protein